MGILINGNFNHPLNDFNTAQTLLKVLVRIVDFGRGRQGGIFSLEWIKNENVRQYKNFRKK